MTDSASDTAPRSASATFLRGLLARDGWAMLTAALLTLAVGMLPYIVARGRGMDYTAGVRISMVALSLWVAGAPAFYASLGRGGLSPWLRGGVVADAAGLVALLLWALGLKEPLGLQITAVLAIYLLFAAVTLTAIAAVCIGRSQTSRTFIAVGVFAVLLFLLASPLWGAGLLSPQTADVPARRAIGNWLLRVNYFHGIDAAASETFRRPWHGSGYMYDLSPMSDYVVAPPVPWYETALLYGALAVALGAAAFLHALAARGRATTASSEGP